MAKLLAALIRIEDSPRCRIRGGANRESGGASDRIAGRGAEKIAADRRAESVDSHRGQHAASSAGRPAGSQRMRYHAGNPLHLDVLVVDEASMIDLPMMSRLIDALPAHGRVIFLGDRDQLASVEAGAVLGISAPGRVRAIPPRGRRS